MIGIGIGIRMLFGYYKRLKMTGGWNWNTIRITIKDLGSLGMGLRTKHQSPWDDHQDLRDHWYQWKRMGD